MREYLDFEERFNYLTGKVKRFCGNQPPGKIYTEESVKKWIECQRNGEDLRECDNLLVPCGVGVCAEPDEIYYDNKTCSWELK